MAPHYDRALVHGRFQPFHRGHLGLIRVAGSIADRVVVAVGNADRDDERHPFPAGLIVEAIKRASPSVDVVVTTGLDDSDPIERWGAHMAAEIASAGFDIDVVVAVLPYDAHRWSTLSPGFAIRTLDARIDDISATEIRRRMRVGESWTQLVPEACAPLYRAYLRSHSSILDSEQ